MGQRTKNCKRRKCLGLDCKVGWFMSTGPDNRFCVRCERLRAQTSRRCYQLVPLKRPETIAHGWWDEP